MKRQKLIVIFGFALFSQTCSIRTTPSSLPSDVDIVREVISYLKDIRPSPRQEDDDDDTTRRPIFPGVAQILLGVVSGDIRRVIEDGIFSFLPKEAQTHALNFFHNLVGRTTPKPTTNTTKAATATTTSSGKTAIKLIPTEQPPATSTTLRHKSTLMYYKATRIPTYRIKSRTSFTLTPSTLATTPSIPSYTATTEEAEITDPEPDPDPDPDPEDGELASRFEEALRPYLPVNPDDAIPQDTPKFISKSRI